jgi:hypothetical protein
VRAIVFGVVLLAATAAQAEDRKCIDPKVASRLCDTKNYVMNPKEYGWYGMAPECRPERGKGYGWKQRTAVICDCLEVCGGSE